MQGLDQYKLLGKDPVGLGARFQGPSRGTINAGSNLYASEALRDLLGVTTFAETARRQMTVVNYPGSANAPGTGRLAFQMLRDGSLVLTARVTPKLGDLQVNLTQILGGPRFVG